MNCAHAGHGTGDTNTALSIDSNTQVIITAITCSLGFLLLGMLLGALIYHCVAVQRVCKSAPPAPNVYEEVPPSLHFERKCDIDFKDNVAYGHTESDANLQENVAYGHSESDADLQQNIAYGRAESDLELKGNVAYVHAPYMTIDDCRAMHA